MNIGSHLETIKESMFKLKFVNELEESNEDNISAVVEDDRLEKLESIVESFRKTQKVNKVKESNALSEYLDKINKMAYKKQWSRLTKYHKSIKLREYADEILKHKKEQDKLYDLLLSSLNNGKLNTNSKVTYDIDKEKIVNIDGLKIEKNNFVYKG